MLGQSPSTPKPAFLGPKCASGTSCPSPIPRFIPGSVLRQALVPRTCEIILARVMAGEWRQLPLFVLMTHCTRLQPKRRVQLRSDLLVPGTRCIRGYISPSYKPFNQRIIKCFAKVCLLILTTVLGRNKRHRGITSFATETGHFLGWNRGVQQMRTALLNITHRPAKKWKELKSWWTRGDLGRHSVINHAETWLRQWGKAPCDFYQALLMLRSCPSVTGNTAPHDKGLGQQDRDTAREGKSWAKILKAPGGLGLLDTTPCCPPALGGCLRTAPTATHWPWSSCSLWL